MLHVHCIGGRLSLVGLKIRQALPTILLASGGEMEKIERALSVAATPTHAAYRDNLNQLAVIDLS